MAPTKKSRSVNKRFSFVNEASPSKDGDAKKNTQRKRKLSDMLGSQWSKSELERFYEAYRKYGTDWKKVVAVVRNRSVEMVEALYTMNKAYLSLPEGTASVVGLIAMMTDHYSNLEGSDSEQESNDGIATSQKSQKRVRSKFQPNASLGSAGHFFSHSQPVASSSGFLLLSKKKRSVGSRARAVGKRTPRFPVSYSYEKVNGEKFFSATRQGLKLKVDANDDDVAHEVALALAEASQKGGSPQVPQTPNRRRGGIMSSSPMRSGERRRAELELTSAKLGSEVDEDGFEGSIGSMEADNGDFAREKNDFRQSEVGTAEGRKGRRLHGKKLDNGNNRLDDIKEACSGTEEGQIIGTVRGKLEFEVTDGKIARSTSQVSRKKSKKVLFGRDEGPAFDALQTLADLSLMMPATVMDNESSVQIKDDDDLVDRYGLLESVPATHERDMVQSSGVKAKGIQIMSGFGASTKTSKIRKASVLDATGSPEAKEESQQSTAKLSRKKQKTSSKIPKTEAHTDDTHASESQDAEGRDAGKKLMSKSKRSGNNSSQKKQGKSVRQPDVSSSTDLRGEKDDSSQSLVHVPVTNQVTLPTKVRSRRKMELQTPHNLKDLKFSDKFLAGHKSNLPISSVQDGSLNLKEKLSNCLSNNRLRRWCAFEWFYSAVDYPWFAKREFVEYLNHVGLGHVPRLTRVEWGVIRSSLGKPRRFSEQFLKEEKDKLNQYRDSVRTHYTELREGTREGLPTDLARPLSVGQRVIAIHPRTREVHDGNVLTVDHSRCRVQFDRPELGVEFVLDVDCMPLNPSENMPASLARNLVTLEKLFENMNEVKMNGWAKDQKLEGHMKNFPGENLEHVVVPSHVSSTYTMSNLLKQAKGSPTNSNSQAKNGTNETANNQQVANSQPSILAQIQAKEADVQALTELTRALDKKEAVVSELRHMNDDVLENQKDGDNTLKDTELFKKQYAAVLVQLNEVNEQVSSALYCLRQRNTYQGNSPLTRLRTTANLGDSGGPLKSFDQPANHPQQSGPHVHEIVESSRTKARTMVDAAMQAITSSKAGGNTFERIEDAIDYVSNRLLLDDSCLLAMRHTAADSIRGGSASHDLLTSSCTSNLFHATGPEFKNVLDRNEAQFPSELISHCVATLLMIQKCTERHFPPADVAVILDSAVTSLQPCCSQNLPVYAEIQKCMGIIKNQILALVPT